MAGKGMAVGKGKPNSMKKDGDSKKGKSKVAKKY